MLNISELMGNGMLLNSILSCRSFIKSCCCCGRFLMKLGVVFLLACSCQALRLLGRRESKLYAKIGRA